MRVFVFFILIFSVQAEKVDFTYQVRPLLSKYCFACHGPDKAKGKLRLDTADGIQKAVTAGNIHTSSLMERILTDDEDDVMPPHETGKKLKSAEIELLKKWINEGAEFGEHWSFQPIKKQTSGTNIDTFIQQELKKQKLTSSPKASKRELIRRVSLDTRGIIPSIEEINQFVNDQDPHAFSKLIDKFLSSPLYGEKWASKWLDLARYADTKGYEKDKHREIWRYRDWVIQALNQDMPYDEFTIKQIAGDLLPNATEMDILATAFHRNTMTNDEGGTDNEEFRTEAVKDRVDTTGTVWLGLSLACAKCHTHKYDPITIDEYYQLYSFFNQSEDNDHNDDRPLQRFPTEWQKKKLAEISKDLKHLTEQREKKFKTATIQESYSKWREQEKDKWNHGTITSLHTTSGVQLIQNKNRITAEKHADSEDTYKIDIKLPAKSYKALKLATFPLEHLPSKGSSFDKEGLYLLSYLQIKKNGKVIKLKKHHSYLQENRSNPQNILSAHDSKISGWALKRFNANKKNLLVIEFEDELKVSTDDQITVELVHNSNFHKKKIASFEVAFSQGQDSPKKTLEKFTINSKQLFFDESKDFKELTQKIAKLEKGKKQNLGSLTPIMKDLPEAKHRKNFIHESGFFLNVGKEVSPATPEFLHSMKKGWPKNRLGFAKWLISKENPLTAKVAANRIWAQIFGRGIIETEEDFGNQGLMPSHPELLDWLAMEYMNNGWSQKKLLKTIFLSDTYQQSSKVTAETLQKDRFNIYLARGPRFRMTAEMIRDSSLKVAGLLSPKMYGNSVMPYQPPGLWMSTYNSMKWQTSKGEDKYRRGVYTYLKRTSPYPTMTAFDAPSRELCTARRIRSNTPLQSLITMNDPVFVEAAQAFARRVIKNNETIVKRIQFAYQTALGRKADPTEVQAINSLLKERLEYYNTYPEEATNMAEKPLGKVPVNISKPQAAAWTAVCNVILNLDEFLTKE